MSGGTTSSNGNLYDDVFCVFGTIDEQRDQVAAILNSKSLEPKTMILQAFRCAMTTRPHTQSSITEGQFFDFAFFTGYANGSGVAPKRAKIPLITASSTTSAASERNDLGGNNDGVSGEYSSEVQRNAAARQRLFHRIGRAELRSIFDVCVRSQGVMNDHSFALAVAHMHLMRYIADVGRVPEVGSKSVRMALSESSDLLSNYVKPRIQPFPFSTEYYDRCSTALRCLWKYSEGLENFYKHYSNNDIFDKRSCEACMVDVGVIPQLSPQAVERLFQQSLTRFRDGESEGITSEGFFECIARIAAAMYADDVFSKRITLESKIEHLITSVLGAAYLNLYGVQLPCETEDVPQPVVTRVEPAVFDEGVTQITLFGDYFGALGRGVWFSSTLSPDMRHVAQSEIQSADTVTLPFHCTQSVMWDACTVTSTSPNAYDFVFQHQVRLILGNTPEDALHRSEVVRDVSITLRHSEMKVILAPTTMQAVEAAFEDGCAQLAYNKGHLYDYCWEYVCMTYMLGSMVSLRNASALDLNAGDGEGGGDSPVFSTAGLLLLIFNRYAKQRERPVVAEGSSSSEGPPPRCALSLASFTEVLCRMAMATGCEVEAVEHIVQDMVRRVDQVYPAVTSRRGSDGRTMVPSTGAQGAADALTDPLAVSRRGSTFLARDGVDDGRRRSVAGDRRASEFAPFDDVSGGSSGSIDGSAGGVGAFRGRLRSFRDNEAVLRTVAAEQRVVKVLKATNSELKTKVGDAEGKRLLLQSKQRDIQKAMAQLRSVIEMVLVPPESDAGKLISKLSSVYRKEMLDVCDRVHSAMSVDFFGGGGSTTTSPQESIVASVDYTAMHTAIQQHLEELKAALSPKAIATSGPARRVILPLKSSSAAPTVDVATPSPAPEPEQDAEDDAALKVRVADLEKITSKLRQERQTLEQELASVRTAMLRQKQAQDAECARLRTVIQERSQVVKVGEEERARLDKANKQLEVLLLQRKQEINKLDLFHRSQEETITQLTAKLADAITKNVQGLQESFNIGDFQASTTGDGGIVKDASDPATASLTTRKKSILGSTGKATAKRRPIDTSLELAAELDAVRASEREFLKDRTQNAVARYEALLEQQQGLQGELDDARRKNTTLLIELRRLYEVLRSLSQLGEEMEDPSSSALATLEDQEEKEEHEEGSKGAEEEGEQATPSYGVNQRATQTPGNTLKMKLLQSLKVALEETVSKSLVLEDYNMALDSVATPSGDDHPHSSGIAQCSASPLGGDINHNRTQGSSRATSSAGSVKERTTPQRGGTSAASAATVGVPPSRTTTSNNTNNNPKDANKWKQKVNAVKESLSRQHLPSSSSQGPHQQTSLYASGSSEPISLANHRMQSGTDDFVFSAAELPSSSPALHQGTHAPWLPPKSSAMTTHNSNAASYSTAGGNNSSAPPPKRTRRQSSVSALPDASYASTSTMCPHCRTVNRILRTHHLYTSKCIRLLRGDLEVFRSAVMADLHNGYSELKERSELIVKAAYFSPVILAAAGANMEFSSLLQHGLRGGASSGGLLPSIGVGAGLRPASTGGIFGTEINVPNVVRRTVGESVGDGGGEAASRATRLAQALAGMKMPTLSSPGEQPPSGSSAAAPLDDGANPHLPPPLLQAALSSDTVGGLMSSITEDSPLAILKGSHIPLPTDVASAVDNTKHWVSGNKAAAPPSPFSRNGTAAGHSRALMGDSAKETDVQLQVGTGGKGLHAKGVLSEQQLQIGLTPAVKSSREVGGSALVGTTRHIEGSVRYRALIPDSATGKLIAQDCEPPRQRIAHDERSRLQTTKHGDVSYRPMTVSPAMLEESPSDAHLQHPEPIRLMVQELLIEASRRGGIGRHPTATPYHAPRIGAAAAGGGGGAGWGVMDRNEQERFVALQHQDESPHHHASGDTQLAVVVSGGEKGASDAGEDGTLVIHAQQRDEEGQRGEPERASTAKATTHHLSSRLGPSFTGLASASGSARLPTKPATPRLAIDASKLNKIRNATRGGTGEK